MTLIRAIGDDSRFFFSWTEGTVEQLRTLAGQNLSASEIAREIGGGVTRSAVIGKASRLGIKIDSGSRGLARPKTKRPPVVAVQKKTALLIRNAPATKQPMPPVLLAKTKEKPAEAAPLRLTITELSDNSCRWPLGDPSDLATFRYCGADRTNQKRATATTMQGGESPYCAAHHRLAYEVRA
jgi:GcrA cell cycle regulator